MQISLRRNTDSFYADAMEAKGDLTELLRRLYRRLAGYPDPAEHSYLAQLRREVTSLRSSAERAGWPSDELTARVDRLAGRVEEYVGANPPRR
jgi:ElaB/YqjD/DUF883 family membrane-anchored ribosome-binding protein